MRPLGVGLLAYLSACIGGADETHDFTEPPCLVLTQASVVDVVSGSLRENVTLVIIGNRIHAVGDVDASDWPKDARVVDAAGRYVIPGLWDMHVHVFNQVSLRPPNMHYFPLFIANGVTGIRELWTKRENMDQVREWRRRQDEGTLLAPRLVAVGILVDGPEGAEDVDHAAGLPGPGADIVSTPEQARRFVRKAKEANLDFVKTYSNLSRETYFAIAQEARQVGIPFAGHVPFAVDAAEASAAGQQTMEHLNQILESSSSKSRELFEVPGTEWSSAHDKLMLDTFDDSRFQDLLSLLAANHTWQVPTLVRERIHRHSGDERSLEVDERLKYLPEQEVESWKAISTEHQRELSAEEKDIRRRHWRQELEVVRRMRDAGVSFLAGTDTGADHIYPGFSLHDELALLVEAGLTPLEALQAATINPARLLNVTDSFGTAEPGKLADLVLLEANPLESIRNTQRIHAVIVNGRILDRRFMDNLLEQAKAGRR